MLACLVKIEPLYRATGERLPVRVSSVNDAVHGPKVNGLGGTIWEPALVGAPVLSFTVWNGDFQAAVSVGNASLTINTNVLKQTFPFADECHWIGSPVEIYAETPGTSWPWRLRFKGKIGGFGRKGDTLTLGCEVDQEPFEADMLTKTYAGTGGAEGTADLKNRVKPLVIGWAENVEPVLIDPINSVFQFSAYGPIEGFDGLFERGASFGAAIGDYADYDALVAATIPAGRWGTCLAEGMVRLGAPNAGVITGDVGGHVVGSATPELTGEVISTLAEIAGIDADSLNSDALAALDAARPFPIALSLQEQTSFLDIAQSLSLACNYQAGVALDGRFTVIKISFDGIEQLTLDALGRSFPQVKESDELDVSPPYWKITVGAHRSWRVHTSDEIAFFANLNPRGRYDDTESYREGDMVDVADGSQWLYINPVASIGNDPPTWPTTSNLYWSNLTPPTNPASIGAATAAEVAAALALAQAKGKVWTGATMPTVAESNVGDTWIGPDGTFYERVNEGGILLGGFAITLGGFRPRLAWTLSANQVLRDTLVQADAAYLSANDAIDQLIGLADDNLISRNEKITKLVPEVSRLEDKWAALSSIAASLSVSTTAAAAARTSWNSFLAGLSPAWNNTAADTVVARSSFNAVRDAYDTALYDLDRAVKEKAATLSTWAGVSGAGRPADNATVGAPTGTPVGSITAGDVSSTINSGGGVASNQVPTAAIQSNAVTVASSAYTATQVSCPAGASFTTVQTLTVSATGGPLFIFFNGQFNAGGSAYTEVEILRGSTVLLSMVCSAGLQTFTAAVTDTPPSGSQTYTVQCRPNSGSTARGVSDRSLFILETKR